GGAVDSARAPCLATGGSSRYGPPPGIGGQDGDLSRLALSDSATEPDDLPGEVLDSRRIDRPAVGRVWSRPIAKSGNSRDASFSKKTISSEWDFPGADSGDSDLGMAVTLPGR